MQQSTGIGATSAPSSLSVVIPAWNEEDVIARAINESLAALSSLAIEFELIVVDDGSTDRTSQFVRAAAEDDPRVKLIELPENRGYGAALRAGFEAARFQLVAFTDADCQFDLADLGHMLPMMEKFEIVSGYRLDRQDSALRCFYSWGYNTLIRALMGCPLRDVDCALKVFRREALLQLLPESARFFANTEMVTEARLKGFSINEVGVFHRPRAAGTSTVSIRDIPRTLSALLPFWWQRLQFGGQRTSEPTSPSAFALTLLMFAAGFLLFRSLAYPLIEPDEGRYAEIAREMWKTGNWVIPRLHREPYLDKPPLFYWLCAGSFSLFGPSDWAARLVPALSAWLTILVTYLFGCRLLGRMTGLLGAWALTLSFGFVCCGRFLILDSLLALLVTMSLFTAHATIARDRFRWGWWLLSALCCGLGVLTKGPVALVLLAPPIVAHAWLNRHLSALSLWRWSVYLGIVAVTTFPWYIAAMQQMPGFAHYFFWEHNIARFVSGSNHPEPFWYYLPALFLSCMPWGLLLIPLVSYLASSSPLQRVHRTREVGFLVLWSAWCLLFFSTSRGKLPTYILPCIPAIMLLIGHYLQENCSPFASSVFVRVRAHAIFYRGILYLATFGILFAGGLVLLELDGRMETIIHGLLWATLLLGAVVVQHRVAPRTVYAVFCLAAFGATAKLTHDVFPDWALGHSVLGTSQQDIDNLQEVSGSLPVACIAGRWGSVPFYLNRDDVVVFADKSNALAHNFIEQQAVSILVIDDGVDAEQLKSLVPQGAQIKRLTSTPRSTVLAVRVKQPTRADIHLMSVELSTRPPALNR